MTTTSVLANALLTAAIVVTTGLVTLWLYKQYKGDL